MLIHLLCRVVVFLFLDDQNASVSEFILLLFICTAVAQIAQKAFGVGLLAEAFGYQLWVSVASHTPRLRFAHEAFVSIRNVKPRPRAALMYSQPCPLYEQSHI